ncbi:hypothetical protein KCU77_g6720, partial [Aureobasidium melanogenum]
KTEDAPAEEEPPLADVSRISVARQDLENLSTKDEPAPAPPVAELPVAAPSAEGHPAAVDSMDFEVPIQKTYHAHPPPAPLSAANLPDQQTNGSV